MTTGLLNKHNQYLAATTHLVALLTTFCLQDDSCTRCQTLQSMTPVHSPIMMTTHLWTLCVRCFLVYHMVAMGICLYGSAPNMATHMASTSSTKLNGAEIHFVHCTSFWSICQNIFVCFLSEYALNRAPELFRFTRLWHDLFHAIGHEFQVW